MIKLQIEKQDIFRKRNPPNASCTYFAGFITSIEGMDCW